LYTAIKIKKTYGTHLECVIKYISILSILNSLPLSKGEISLLSFACVYGDISTEEAKQEFMQIFSLSKRFFENSVYKFLKMGLLYKEGGKLLLNKQLHIEFDSLMLKIEINEAP